MAVHDLAREHVDRDLDRLAGMNVGELRLLVVGDDIGAVGRHHRHQLRAGLHVLADAQRAVADDAVDRRDDRGVGEIELGLVLHRLGARERRLGLRELGLQQVDLLRRGGEGGGVARECGLRAGDPRLRLLRVLHAAVAVRGEVGVALVVLLGEGHAGLIDVDGRLCGIDDRLLGVELAPACWRSRPWPRRRRPWPARARP